MSTIEKVAAGMFFLIGVYIIVTSGGSFNTVINAIGRGVTATTETLQGRG